MDYRDSEGVMAIVITVVIILVGIAAIVYVSEHISCFNWFGITKGCVVR